MLLALALGLIACRALDALLPPLVVTPFLLACAPLAALFLPWRHALSATLGVALASAVPVPVPLAEDAEPFPVALHGFIGSAPAEIDLFGSHVRVEDGPELAWSSHAPAPPAGSEVIVRGRLDGTGRRIHLLSDPQAHGAEVASAPRWRSALAERIGRGQSAHTQALLGALLLGEGRMDRDFQELWRQTGTWHLVAISGMHLVILLGMLRFLTGPRPLLLLPVVIGYALLCGLGPPLQRAMITSCLVLAAPLTGRAARAPRNFVLALAAVLLFWPESARHPGFWLTFAATGGILFGAIPRNTRPPGHTLSARIHAHLLSDLRLSIAASTASAPVLAVCFHQITPGSILGTMLLAPGIFVLLAGGLLKMVCPGLPFLPELLETVVAFTTWLLEWLATVPASALSVAPPSACTWSLIAVALACFLCGRGWPSLLAATVVIHGALLAQPAPGPRLVLVKSTPPLLVLADGTAGEVLSGHAHEIHRALLRGANVHELVSGSLQQRTLVRLIQNTAACEQAIASGADALLWRGNPARLAAATLAAAAGVPLQCARRGSPRIFPQPSAP